MINNFAILNDKDTFNLFIVKDSFNSEQDAINYMLENNLDEEDNFIVNLNE